MSSMSAVHISYASFCLQFSVQEQKLRIMKDTPQAFHCTF